MSDTPDDDRPPAPNHGPGPIDRDEYPGQAARDALLGLPNVQGHAIGFREKDGELTDEVVVRVLVSEKVPDAALSAGEKVPRVLEGVPTDVVEARDERHDPPTEDSPEYTIKGSRSASYQPAPAGALIQREGASTIGSGGGQFFRTGEGIVGVTASHLFDNQFQTDATGMHVAQPSGGRRIGTVSHTEPFDSTDFCDIVYWNPASSAEITNRAFGLGSVTNVISPVLGMRNTFTGWRTGITGGQIVSIDGTATFTTDTGSQTIRGVFEVNQGSDGGNSGSLVGAMAANGDLHATGVLVGGRVSSGVRTTLIISFDHMAQSGGLGPLEAHAGGSDHPPITTGSQYIEGHVRRIDHNAATNEFEVEVYMVNTGGATGTDTPTVYEWDGTTYTPLLSTSVTLASMESTRLEFAIPDWRAGEELMFATQDMLDEFAADTGNIEANADFLGFVVEESYDVTAANATVSPPSVAADVSTGLPGVSVADATAIAPDAATATTTTGLPGVRAGAQQTVGIQPGTALVDAHANASTVVATVAPEVPDSDFDYDDIVRAASYGNDGFGAGAYGRDFNPWTTEHGWVLPLRGEPPESYHEKVASVADEIDRLVAKKGPLDERPSHDTTLADGRPLSAHDPGRLYLSTDDGDDGETKYLYYDNGDRWELVDFDIALDEDALTDGAEETTVSGTWEFLRRPDADITGSASSAIYADTVDAAFSTDSLDGDAASEYVTRTGDLVRVDGQWTFEKRVRLRNSRSRQLGGSITLPIYEQPEES